ncbi:methyl-accepting chemotaxis protein [Desertibacillus haloalkaliphilus]|uniref:methyl-accepting chemotaxis protein n=1 Tax=Desertibacillus haloalkaliphilus TaxID=1328930 RepID=UPI001C25FB52|nr:methyl-accepting chemotaxis protein [Desertibacillus haloalkaliphilus]MBU8906429.1 methyl-accepting chemotaxis protein [Desertibacillus haloalkaliphilus]
MKSLKLKILGGFGLVLLTVLIMAIFGYVGMSNYTDDVRQMVEEEYELLKAAEEMKHNVTYRVVTARGYILYGDPTLVEEFEELTEYSIATQEMLIETLGNDPEYADAIATADERTARWRTLITDEVVPTFDDHDGVYGNGNPDQYSHTFKRPSFEETIDIMEEFCTIYAIEAIEAWQEIFDLQDAKIVELEKELIDSGQLLQWIFIAISGAAILIAVTAALIISNMIVRPISSAATRLEDVANGNLTGEPLAVQSKDEVGRLTESLNQMVENLRGLVGEVESSSRTLAASSDHMAASSDEITNAIHSISGNAQVVAKDAEKGNATMLEVSETLLELSSLIQIAKEKSFSSADNSKITYKTAERGKETVREAVECMENIKISTDETEQFIETLNEFTKEIKTITEMITNISQQTNLLSLNASIEAARAGEAGKGFAVVADEVQKLAEQSSKGATKVADLISQISNSTDDAVRAIKDSKSQVDRGTSIVGECGDSLEEILQAVRKTVNDIESISEVASEEIASSEKIVELIDSLATGIENTSVNAQETSTSSDDTKSSMESVASVANETNQLAQHLRKSVDKFKI